MADTILAYFLYESDLGREAKADIVESFYSLSGVDPTEPLERIREHLESLPHVYVSLRYESIQPAFVAIPEKNRNLFPELSQMRLHISEEHYQPGLVTDEEVTEHVCDFVDLAVHTYEASREAGYEPRYVLGADPDQVNRLHSDATEAKIVAEGILSGELEALFMFQILPPAMVESVGRDVVLSAPAWRVEELDDGAVLLAVDDHPFASPERFRAVQQHLSLSSDAGSF